MTRISFFFSGAGPGLTLLIAFFGYLGSDKVDCCHIGGIVLCCSFLTDLCFCNGCIQSTIFLVNRPVCKWSTLTAFATSLL